ncbi:hypothetical protein [Shewanella surugensis]|uniref:Organic solvent tolerance-like N-terminal domain-containing protein n=1 Tax=Shewanella surugensis TaxID=212020 RepID=A0ABT0LAS6_9GAMM|nr:hypothetical protein [Shewanella surugensis]MCL1124777.1 hypothetical protein [Shewanella surugensis]
MRTYTGSISSFTGWMTMASLGLTSLALTPSALAMDYYASEQWFIQQDFTIDAGDRVIVAANTQIYLNADTKLTINPEAVLILEEGVNIDIGQKGSIAVYGELSSLGHEYNMNRFQSVQLAPTNSDWQGIDTYNGSVVNLRHTQISHASNAIYAHIGTTILFPNEQTELDTHDSEIRNDHTSQLNIRYSNFNNNHTAINISEQHTFGQLESVIQYNQFNDNQYHLYTSSQAHNNGLQMSPVIVDARFNWWSTTDTNRLKQQIQDTQENNQDTHALRVDYSHYRQSIYDNDILTNAFLLQLPLKLKRDDPITIDPGFNRESHYRLDGNFLIAGDTKIKPYQLATLTTNSMLTVSENTTLTLDKTARFIAEPGAVIYLSKNSQINVQGHWQLTEGVQVIAEEGAQINISGSLYAQGTSTNRVNFSAASHLVDQNWQGIQLSQGAEINLNYAQIQHAQQGVYANLVPSIVNPVEDNTASISPDISDDQPTSLQISHTRFINNHQAIRLDVVPETQALETQIEYNDFVDNSTHLFTQVYPFHAYGNGNGNGNEAELNLSESQPFSPIVINAKFNWWDSNLVSDIAATIIDFQQAVGHTDGLHVDYSEYRQSMALNDIARNTLVVKLPEYLKVSDPFQIDPGYNLETEYRLEDDFVIVGDTHFSRYQIVTLTTGSNLHISDDISLSISPNAIFIIESGASITFGHNSQLLSQGQIIDQNH